MSIVLDGTSGITSPSVTGTPVIGGLVSGTAVASTSGTSIDFTGIPSWVKRITVMFAGVSTSGTSFWQIQVGDSGGIESSGYSGAFSGMDSGVGTNLLTTGFGVRSGSAANIIYGQIFISSMGENLWAAAGVLSSTAGAAGSSFLTSGTKTLSDTLDRIRITTVNGTDTFDAGSINIIYEG